MILNYLFLLAGILMVKRKVYLYMAPIFIGMSWRFGMVTSMRSFTIDEIMIAVSLLKIAQYMIIRRFEYRMPLLRWHAIYLAGVAFTFTIGLLLFQSYDPAYFNDLILLHFKMRLYLPIVFAATFVMIESREEGLRILRWFLIVSVPFSIYAIIQYHYFVIPRTGDFGSFWLYSWYDEDSYWKIFSTQRAFGTMAHPAALGRYLMMVVIVALAQGIHGVDVNRGAWRPALAIAVLAFYAMGVTGSRGPTVGLALGIAAIIYLERKSFSRNFILVVVLVMAFTYAVPEIMSERVGQTVEEGAEEMGIATRVVMWQDLTADVLTANPITGYGPKYEVCYDNDFVSIIYEGGFLLLLLFGLWILSMYQLGSVGVQEESRLAQMSGVIVLGVTVAMLGAGFSGRSFFNPKIGIEFMFILAICGKIITLASRESRQRAWERYRASLARTPE